MRYEITKGCQYDASGACLIEHGSVMSVESFRANGQSLAGYPLGGASREQILAAVRETILDGLPREITIAEAARAISAIGDESWITDSRNGFAE